MSKHQTIKETVATIFTSNLHRGLGDLETMIAGLWYRTKNNGALLDPYKRPPGYRSPKIREFLQQECKANKTTLWGPTAIRGDLGEADKDHIIQFFKLLNEVPTDLLEETLKMCGNLYAEKVNTTFSSIVLPTNSVAQMQFIEAVQVQGTVGKIQQGLVYATLLVENTFRQDESIQIITKRTHAGDQQSGAKGDIVVLQDRNIITAYEIKGTLLTQQNADRFLPLHGKHEYSLFILALDFKPKSLQNDLNSYTNTFAIHLVDFLLTKLADIQLISGLTTESILHQIISIYNQEFCESIENDPSIKITPNKE